MKCLIRFICIAVAIAILLPTAVFAEQSSTRSSAYFAEIQYALEKVSTYTFRIWFDVTATGMMDILGVSKIELQRSEDNSNWTTIKTYEPDRYSQMQEENTCSHSDYVSYTGMKEYYYRAQVTFYAKKGTGTGLMTRTAASLYMP